MEDIPNLIKHWPCAVKTHFPGQQTLFFPSLYIYISIYIYMFSDIGLMNHQKNSINSINLWNWAPRNVSRFRCQEQVVTGMQWPPPIFVAWERTLASLVAAAWSTSGTPGILPSTHLGIVYTTYLW